MLEIFEYNKDSFGSMVVVDIVIGQFWMAIILLGIGKRAKIDRWLKADNSAIEELQIKVTEFTEKIKRNPTLTDFMIILGRNCAFWC